MREKPKAAACWRTIAALLCQPGSPIPNDNGLLVMDRVPLRQVLQKINGVVTVASTLMPDETLTMAKIISPIPVKPIFERGEVLGTQSGSPTADQR